MRRILAVAVLALAATVGLPAASQAGGPTSVLITQPGQSAGALYYDDAAYDALLGLLPTDETRGEPLAPGGGAHYNLTWLVHDVMPWRFDRVQVAADGTAWVSTTFSAEDSGGWVRVAEADELSALLTQVLDDSAAPEVVSIPAGTTPAAAPAPAPAEPGTAWFSLTGWRWVVPGVLLGLAVGAVAARRPRDGEPRRVLVSSEA
ncbi:hypothetical protein AAII07_38455 [Microvirga sp. 0TCS3.31]